MQDAGCSHRSLVAVRSGHLAPKLLYNRAKLSSTRKVRLIIVKEGVTFTVYLHPAETVHTTNAGGRGDIVRIFAPPPPHRTPRQAMAASGAVGKSASQKALICSPYFYSLSIVE